MAKNFASEDRRTTNGLYKIAAPKKLIKSAKPRCRNSSFDHHYEDVLSALKNIYHQGLIL